MIAIASAFAAGKDGQVAEQCWFFSPLAAFRKPAQPCDPRFPLCDPN